MGLLTPPTGAAPTPWQAILRTIKRVAGMPDYAGYLDHLHRYHPERQVPTEREFYEEFIRSREGRAFSRCC